MLGLDVEFLLDLEEGLDRVDHVEDGDVSTGFGQTFSKGETAASCTACDECRTAVKREL